MGWLQDLLLAILSLTVVLLFGAMVELHRQFHQLRQFVGLVDRSVPLDVEVGVSTVDAGLEFPDSGRGESGDLTRNALLILSDSCATCNDIAPSLQGFRLSTPGFRVILEARSAEDAEVWLSSHGIHGHPRVSVDEGGRTARALGVDVTPALVRFENARAASALTVPTVRTLDSALAWVDAAGAEEKARTQ